MTTMAALAANGAGTTLVGRLPPRIFSPVFRRVAAAAAAGLPYDSLAASARSMSGLCLLRSGVAHPPPSSRRCSFAATTTTRAGPTPRPLARAALRGIGLFPRWTSSRSVVRSLSSWWRGTSFLAAEVAPPRVRSWSPPSSLPLLRTATRHKHTIKTNKSASKRFRARGDGTLVRMKAGKSHNTGDKPRARKNRLGQSTTVSEPKVERKIKRVLPQ